MRPDRDGPGPRSDTDVADWVRGLGLDGIVDIHVHFLPERVLRKVWAYFDDAERNYGMRWPVRYRVPQHERIATLRSLGVRTFAPLVYPHKPDMADWLNTWVREFAAEVPEAVPTATLYAEPTVSGYVAEALAAGVRCFKAHVQVGGYDPADAILDGAWGLIADAAVPVVVHCGHGPLRGEHTGIGVFEQVLRRHPGLVTVLAHAGMPEYDAALALVRRYPNVYLDTTMVGVPFTEEFMPVPSDWPSRLAELADRVVLGTDFPNIPYSYATQLRAVAGWAESDPRLGRSFLRAVLHDTPSRLLRQAPASGSVSRSG
ncbi:amidohydrolase family protein [Saccharomonospora xinjiangensis]|uniref:Putative TIM-barrel fold metal-dependent hydrolase n=1 Tax=Saccharomonospora xinjiangensis XJ-54 TaxID=882086 RepID=I0V023_9PSEU|nr:amidohydrolase family protein [Saccharomonospora xinjiangensis]EID53476.1 putative TIM-barrel fold metal-dependent hydrolase [Saccharomonospora xinjiangensis XJ-54]